MTINKIIKPFLMTASMVPSQINAGQAVAEKPNIIFVLVDDLRWDAMGFMGKYPFLKTPNIDRLRKEGVHFRNAFCTHSLCAPSRSTILTGTYPHTNGVITNQEGREFNPEKTPSFAQILQENNYKTGFIGKWHMAETNSPRKGFNFWVSFTGQGNYNGNNLNINGEIVRNEGYITNELNRYALEFIRNNAGNPFCLYLSHKAVHQPFTPAERDTGLYAGDLVPEPPGWSDKMESKPAWQRIELNMEQRLRWRDKDLSRVQPYKTRNFGPWPVKTGRGEQKNYLRCLTAVDRGLGDIYELLEKEGILDNTVIVFAGDNGYFHGEHGKGDKRLAYNESMRIPLVMRYPKEAKAGMTVSEMVLNADIAPTFLDLAGVKIPEQMQGKTVIPLLHGKNEGWRKSFLFTYWPDLTFTIPRITAIRTERYLYSKTPDIKDIDELYDEEKDPAELNNLSENPAFATLKQKLSEELEALKKATDYRDEVPRPDPEPVWKGKTGKLLSIDFTGLSSGRLPDMGIQLNGVKNSGVGEGRGADFTDDASAVIPNTPDLDPSKGTFIVDCIVKPGIPDGVIASSGSQKDGWAIYVENGIPGFVVSRDRHLQFVDGTSVITGTWSHLVAVIENYKNLISLYADGKLLQQRTMLLPIQSIPGDEGNITLGRDDAGLIDPRVISNYKFVGTINQFSVFREKKSVDELARQSSLKEQ